MSVAEKAQILFDIVVNECYCDWMIFQENVRSQGDAEFRKNLGKCNSKEDLQKLVNQYI